MCYHLLYRTASRRTDDNDLMDFRRRARGSPATLGILSGTFNPPTEAHLALAEAGLTACEEVVFVMPRVFPHKPWEGATPEQRLAMLEAAVRCEPRYSIACTEGGLFIEIAQECRAVYGARTTLKFLCGRDAAERMVNWDYGRPGAIGEMLAEFELLVAGRQGGYEPPPELQSRIHPLRLAGDYEEVSATEVRRRMASGERWEHLVPEAIAGMARAFYCFTAEPQSSQRG
jgi:nicotinate-nucleotide adenylyltransferase